MSQRKGDLYTFGFATAICFACSLILALAATALKPMQQANMRIDIIENLLSAVGYQVKDLKAMPTQQVFDLYSNEFEVRLLNKENLPSDTAFMKAELLKVGYPKSEIDGLDTAELLARFNARVSLLAAKANQKLEAYDPGYKLVYVYKPKGVIEAYVIPITGYGLWDIIKGYVALDTDLNTIKGISFYEHKETPGLGARITEDWFKDNFLGKKILDTNGHLTSITVAKGKVKETVRQDQWDHYVDGISGATLTGKGINQFLKQDLELYEPYFKTLRSNS